MPDFFAAADFDRIGKRQRQPIIDRLSAIFLLSCLDLKCDTSRNHSMSRRSLPENAAYMILQAIFSDRGLFQSVSICNLS